MATRLTLATSTRRLIDETDSSNSHFEDAELYDYINQAIRFLGTDLEWPIQTAQATAVQNQAVYTLPNDFISMIEAFFDNRALTILERQDLKAMNSEWQNDEASTPRIAYKSDNAKVGMYPKPDADSSGLLIQIQYVKLPPNLEDDTTAPDLHTAFQDCLPFYAAFLCERRLGNLKSSKEHLEIYEFHKKRITSRVQRYSDDLLRFRWTKPHLYGGRGSYGGRYLG